MRKIAAQSLSVLALSVVANLAYADKVIWKYDNLAGDMEALVEDFKSHPESLYAHPGFIQGEAFGQVYKPKPADYPVKILTVELVMAQPNSQLTPKTLDITIEIWNDDSPGPAPKSSAPLWSINSKDFANGGSIGVPVVGNTAMIYQFDWSKPENHPPPITSGNIFVMIRIDNPAKDLATYWGKDECSTIEIPGLGSFGCGCEDLAGLTDKITTNGANVMHIIWPLGQCKGAKAWKFVEQLTNQSGFTMKGDFILRLGVDGVPDVPPDVDSGSAPDSGTADAGGGKPDVPGDSAPSDLGPADVVSGDPSIDLVTPNSGPADKASNIDIVGKNFQVGATVKLGATAIAVSKVTPTTISATVVGIAAGAYDVVVTNPDGKVAFKSAAYTVTATAVTDAGPTDTGPIGKLAVVAVEPNCVATSKTTVITISGSGFTPNTTFKLGSTQLLAVDVSASGNKATAVVPAGIAAGQATLIAEIPGGGNTFLTAPMVVGSCGASAAPAAAPSGCEAGAHGNSATLLLFGVGMLALAASRRRAAAAMRG